MIGTTLGSYKLLDKIGGGGFAQVYLARDTRTNQVVALKVLRSEYVEDPEFIARFRHEAQALLRLPPNPHIVALHEFGEQNGTYFLAMEYLEGHDLQEVIRRQGALPVETTVSIVAQVAEALAVALQGGVVHRDVKPANIKINPQGVAKIMDFGIARAAEGTRLTRTGMTVGTPSYMAPELWEGKPAGPQSDVYALGVMLCEMLLGQSPFEATTPAATMRRHLTEPPPRLNVARPDVPPWLAEISDRALAKDPAQRYCDAGELLAALSAHGQVPQRVDVATLVTARPAPKAAKPLLPADVRAPNDNSLKLLLALASAVGVVLIGLIVFAVLSSQGKRAPVAVAAVSPSATFPSVEPTVTARTTLTPMPSATWTLAPSPTLSASPTSQPRLTATPAPAQRPAPTSQPNVAPTRPPALPTGGSRTVTLVYPANDAVFKSSVITFKWSGGALQPGEAFIVEVIPNMVDKGEGCILDEDDAGVRWSPPLTEHEWTTDFNAKQPGNKWMPCAGQIDWRIHLRDASGVVVQRTPQSWFFWEPL